MVTASARVGARSRANRGEPSSLVPEPWNRPKLYSSWAESWASSGVAAQAGAARDRARAVSYTHLDVYKRQAPDDAGGERTPEE